MRLVVALLLSVVLTGCAADEGGTLSCPAPGSTGCDSLDTVYQRTTGSAADTTEPSVRRLRTLPAPRTPSFHPPKVVRVWLAPWVDEDGDLHDYQYLHLVIGQAGWDVDNFRIPPAQP